jgi:diketogulonate reductase-like aldo/keto reductase
MPHTTLFLTCSYKQHVKDNRKVFSFKLDEQDKAAIAAVQQKGKSLSGAFGNFL